MQHLREICGKVAAPAMQNYANARCGLGPGPARGSCVLYNEICQMSSGAKERERGSLCSLRVRVDFGPHAADSSTVLARQDTQTHIHSHTHLHIQAVAADNKQVPRTLTRDFVRSL